jgi:hypothetical protein
MGSSKTSMVIEENFCIFKEERKYRILYAVGNTPVQRIKSVVGPWDWTLST